MIYFFFFIDDIGYGGYFVGFSFIDFVGGVVFCCIIVLVRYFFKVFCYFLNSFLN